MALSAFHNALRLNRSVFNQQQRNFGIFGDLKDKFVAGREEKNKEKADEFYKKNIRQVAESKVYNLKTFHDMMKEAQASGGSTGWMAKLPGVSSLPQIQEINTMLKILDTIPENMKEEPDLFNGREKRKVSLETGESVEKINILLRQYEQMFVLRKWLKKRVERGLPLPENQEETMNLVQQDPTGFSTKKFSKRIKNRGRSF